MIFFADSCFHARGYVDDVGTKGSDALLHVLRRQPTRQYQRSRVPRPAKAVSNGEPVERRATPAKRSWHAAVEHHAIGRREQVGVSGRQLAARDAGDAPDRGARKAAHVTNGFGGWISMHLNHRQAGLLGYPGDLVRRLRPEHADVCEGGALRWSQYLARALCIQLSGSAGKNDAEIGRA